MTKLSRLPLIKLKEPLPSDTEPNHANQAQPLRSLLKVEEVALLGRYESGQEHISLG
jgi:hypothetical protein